MIIRFLETPSPWLVRQHAQVPLGPLYLATILDKAGHDARLYRMAHPYDIPQADVLAFSGTTLEYPMVRRAVNYIKDRGIGSSLWYGGPHATVVPHQGFDAIAIGESESFIVQMAKDLDNNTLKSRYGPAEPVDINLIPIPNRDLIDGKHGKGIFSFEQGTNENVITSRGCGYRCHFCASKSMWRGVRYRSTENVLEEVRGMSTIRFADDNFTSNKERLYEICAGLSGNWRCSARADTLLPSVCQAMAEGGCKEVSIGAESADQRVLDFLNKRTNVHKVEQGVLNAVQAGINVRGLFMIGTPGEREDTPEINRDFINRIPFHSLTLSTFIPLPGSEIIGNRQRGLAVKYLHGTLQNIIKICGLLTDQAI